MIYLPRPSARRKTFAAGIRHNAPPSIPRGRERRPTYQATIPGHLDPKPVDPIRFSGAADTMLFSQIAAFDLADWPDPSLDTLVDRLAEKRFAPTLSQQVESMGWAPVVSDALALETDGAFGLLFRREERAVPPRVIQDHAAKKLAEESGEREPSRDELRQARESALLELLPQAFPRQSETRVLICLLYTSPSPRDRTRSRMPSSA